MRVIHIITGLGQGGAEAMLEKLLLASRKISPEISQEVISLGSLGHYGPKLLHAGFKIHAVNLSPSLGGLCRYWQLIQLMRCYPKESIIQTWMYHGDLIGGLTARLAGLKRIVWNIRQTGLRADDISPSTRFIVRLSGWLSHYFPRRVICNSKLAVPIHAAWGYKTSHFRVIPNGFNTDKLNRSANKRSALRLQWGITDEQLLIGLVARLDPQKDHANFINMADIVATARPDARFVLVGPGIPNSSEIRRHLQQLGLERRFTLVGPCDDIESVMSSLDIFCLSSRAEGFPNVLGEAMACEAPCVTTDCGDAAEVLSDPRRVAPTNNSEALADIVLKTAALSIHARREIGIAQRLRIQNDFSIEAVWRQYKELYEQIQFLK